MTAHIVWMQFYIDLLTFLDIAHTIRERKEGDIITISIYRKSILSNLSEFIELNNLFHLERKWKKLKTQKDPLREEELSSVGGSHN